MWDVSFSLVFCPQSLTCKNIPTPNKTLSISSSRNRSSCVFSPTKIYHIFFQPPHLHRFSKLENRYGGELCQIKGERLYYPVSTSGKNERCRFSLKMCADGTKLRGQKTLSWSRASILFSNIWKTHIENPTKKNLSCVPRLLLSISKEQRILPFLSHPFLIFYSTKPLRYKAQK